jgi:ribonuclease D
VGQEKNGKVHTELNFEFIDTPEALTDFAQAVADSTIMAVDLEADSMFHYQERVCLLQIAANGRHAVIDPLKLHDLSSLKPLFASRSMVKVFHGADYDVRSLYRDFGIIIHNLFDTQLACMYLGYQETGLDAVVADRFGVELNKKFQKKDWSQRPLPREMITYAALDVVYLIPLSKALRVELKRKSRLQWVLEQCELLSRVRPNQNGDKPLFLRFKGAGRLTPRQLASLEALLQMRDAIACQKNRPWFKIMSNRALLHIATAMPTTLKRLKKKGILSDRQMEMYAHEILAVIKEAGQLPQAELPHYPRHKSPRLSPRVPRRVKALREWRDRQAARLKLDPALLLNKSLIRDIAIRRPADIVELADVAGIHKWQVDTFGEQILKTLQSAKG